MTKTPNSETLEASIERTTFDFARPRTIRLLLPQYRGQSSYWTRHDGLFHPSDGAAVEEQIVAIVATARRVAANAVILPELGVPESLVHHLQKWSAESGGVAIAGSHYFKHDQRYVARCPVIIAGKVYFTEKLHPAPSELSALPGRGLSPGKRIHVFYNTPIGTFSVLICSDFLMPTIRKAVLDAPLDLLFVPAFQRTSGTYHSRMGIECEESQQGIYIAYCNMHVPESADGQTALFGIVDNLWSNDLIESKVTNGIPKQKLCELSSPKQHAVIDLDIEVRRPLLGRTVQSRPNFQLIEFATIEKTRADEFTTLIAHDDERYRRLLDFFVPPAEYDQIQSQLERDRLVFIVGDPGMGKTYTAAALLKSYFDKGYQPVWFMGIEREERQLQRQTLESFVPKPRQIIYFEDPFGRTSFERRDVLYQVFRPLIDRLKHVDARVLITSRREVFERFTQESLSIPELSSLCQDMSVVKPSYTEERLREILHKLAQGKCQWFADPKLREVGDEAIVRKQLCTPWAIRDFLFSSQAVCNRRELITLVKRRQSENSLTFAQEVASSPASEQLLLCLIYLFGTHESAQLSVWHTQIKKELRTRGIDTGIWTFAEQLRSHLGFRIEHFGTARTGLRFTHPIYEDAVAQAAGRNVETQEIMAGILRVVERGSPNIAVHAVSRNAVKQPLLASRLFDLLIRDKARKVSEQSLMLGERLASVYRITKFTPFLETLSHLIDPLDLATFINKRSNLGELVRYLRFARNYQELLPDRADIAIGDNIEWPIIFKRLTAKPKYGPWARVVEVAAWFDKNAVVVFLSGLSRTLLRSRFLELVEAERRGVLKAVEDTPLFDRLSKLKGSVHLPLSRMPREKLDKMIDVSALASGVTIADGAADAVTSKKWKNLLPPGVLEVSGVFEAGEFISVFSRDGHRIGVVVTEYSSAEINLIKGFHSSQIAEILGQSRSCEVFYGRQFHSMRTTVNK
jgi:predicted amidohydrolase/GTPase SAR1 family protein